MSACDPAMPRPEAQTIPEYPAALTFDLRLKSFALGGGPCKRPP